MKAIIDSGVFIGSWHKGDSWSDRAGEIIRNFTEGTIDFVFITNYVVVEVINFLLKKVNFEETLKAYDYLTKTDRIKVVYVDDLMDEEIKSLFLKYKSLTLTDCSLIALAKLTSVRNLYSFDKGFDRAREVVRLES